MLYYTRQSCKTRIGSYIITVMPNEILEAKEVAAMLKVSVRSITRLAEKGELVGFKVGDLWRFQHSDVEAYIEAQKRKQQHKMR
ncbi:MAG TPA: helix-turn-helix domain-containing protein [Ktedonobacteraceae bacterium]|nr:helix-turn-helix domain-containing protein [Ktedonobacteraceae bacterium]